jgi:hypothetical protein
MSDAVDPVESMPVQIHNLRRELAEAKNQRDRLADALRGFRRIHSELWDHGYVAPEAIAADKALAAVKGGTQ